MLEFLIDHDQLSIFAGIKVNYIFSTLSDSCYFYEIRIGMAQFRTQSSSLLVFRLSYQKKKNAHKNVIITSKIYGMNILGLLSGHNLWYSAQISITRMVPPSPDTVGAGCLELTVAFFGIFSLADKSQLA